jgi:hypothetical protein
MSEATSASLHFLLEFIIRTSACAEQSSISKSHDYSSDMALFGSLFVSRWAGLLFKKKLKLNSVAWVRERTIPTERPPLAGEVSGKIYG